MKVLLKLLILRCKLQASEWVSNAVSIFLFALSISLMSVFFLFHIYSSDLIEIFNGIAENIFEMTGNVLFFLAIICIAVSVLGHLSLLHLKVVKFAEKNALLRVFGMTQNHTALFAFFDTIMITLISSILGTVTGIIFFIYTSNLLAGFNVTIKDALSYRGLVLFLQNFFLFLPLILSGYLWMYSKIHGIKMISVFRKRPTIPKVTKSSGWIIGGVLIFIISYRLLFGDVPYLGSQSIFKYIFYTIVILYLVYVFFCLGFGCMKKFRINLESTTKLSFILFVRRRKFTAMIGTAIMVMAIMTMILYNVQFGIDKFFHNLFVRMNGYNTIVVVSNEQEDELIEALNDSSIKYYIAYTKDRQFSGSTGNGERRYYALAIIRDELNIVPDMAPSGGHFFTNGYFLYHELGITYPGYIKNHIYSTNSEIYYFLFDKNLQLTGEIKDQLGSIASYSIAVSYEDFIDAIDDSFNICLLMSLSAKESEIIQSITADYNAVYLSASEIVKTYMDELSSIIIYIYLTCIIITLMAGSFLFIVTYTAIISRKRELELYKILGASKSDISIIILIENILITFVAAIMTFAVNYGLFNLISAMQAGTLAYTIPAFVILSVLFGLLSVIAFITYISSKIMQFDSVAKILRVD